MFIPAFPDICLKFSEKFLNWVQVRRVRWQEAGDHSSFIAHLLHFLRVMKRRIIHNQDRFGLRPLAAVGQKCLNEILEESGVCGTLVHPKMYDTILCIRREDLESSATVELLDLASPLSSGSPTFAPVPNASVHPRFVYKYQLIGAEGRYFIHIFVSQVLVALLGDVLRDFLRPRRTFQLQSSDLPRRLQSLLNMSLKSIVK